MSCRRSQWNETRKKTSIALLQCTQGTEAYWDRKTGSSKADNLLTALQTEKWLDVDIHPDFGTLMEHKAFLSTWCKTFLHTREKEVFFRSRSLLHKLSPRRTISGDVGGNSAANDCSRRVMHPISLVSDADFEDRTHVGGEKHSPIEAQSRISQRRSMKQNLSDGTISFTALMNLLLSVALPSSSIVTMAVSIPHWVVKSGSLSQDEDNLREDYYYECLAFSRLTINLEFDEETMKPEKTTEAPRNAGVDPCTMKMKQRYQGHDRESDQKAPTGTERASCHVREPILSSRDEVTCLHQYLNELPIRKFEKTEQYRTSDKTRKRCTVPPPRTPAQKQSLTVAEVSFHNL